MRGRYSKSGKNYEHSRAATGAQARQDKLKVDLGSDYIDDDLICCRSNGLPIKPKCFSSDVRDTIRKAGLSLRFHDLRHSHATHLSMQGTSFKVIQERLGHTSLSATMNTYIHAAPNMQREAFEQLDQSLRARLPENDVQRTEELE